MKSLSVSNAFKLLLLSVISLSLTACGDGENLQIDNPKNSSQEQQAIASMVVDVPEPLSQFLPESEPVVASVPMAAVSETARNVSVREFNPADFPDACNDYIDEVLQCIKVMDQAGMDGTASMQMQLSEMQASWLKQTDAQALSQTCQFALLDMAPVLQDLGC